MSYSIRIAVAAAVALVLSSTPARAATIWVDWLTYTGGAPGSAEGKLGALDVTYDGEVLFVVTNGGAGDVWSPDSSYTGGSVTDSPASVGDGIALTGFFYTGISSITFSAPVVDPVIAFWSLGSERFPATFSFINATPTVEAGGPSTLAGGGSVTVNGNVVSGNEGNGVVKLSGLYTTLMWTSSPDFLYAFTVGADVPSTPPAVPEPASLVLLGTGIATAFARRFRRA